MNFLVLWKKIKEKVFILQKKGIDKKKSEKAGTSRWNEKVSIKEKSWSGWEEWEKSSIYFLIWFFLDLNPHSRINLNDFSKQNHNLCAHTRGGGIFIDAVVDGVK